MENITFTGFGNLSMRLLSALGVGECMTYEEIFNHFRLEGHSDEDIRVSIRRLLDLPYVMNWTMEVTPTQYMAGLMCPVFLSDAQLNAERTTPVPPRRNNNG